MSKTVVIFDYGFGNVRSVQRAFEHIGAKVLLTDSYEESLLCDKLVVPGVGAFGACMQGLTAKRGDEIIKVRHESSQDTLGICVGHQILFDASTEGAGGSKSDLSDGLKIIPGVAVEVVAKTVPHMGWNNLDIIDSMPVFSGVSEERFYFVHSYAVPLKKGNFDLKQVDGYASTIHEEFEFISAVQVDSTIGLQFHPEKSGEAGLHLLENWLNG
jgi:glutamine amidotransferase